MSGIEIIGIVLAALPLFISAAEHYREGLGFVKRAVKKQSFITQYRDELVEQRTLLGLYIKAVVGRTNVSAEIQADLVERPGSDVWRKAEVVEDLSKELGDAYQLFVSLLMKICATLAKQIKTTEIAESPITDDELLNQLRDLCIDTTRDDTATRQEPREIWRRIKFSWKHHERETLLAELKAYNRSLEKLGSASNHAKPYERKQQMRKIHATFELRDETERLYRVMCKACSCQPCRQKDVGLGLAVHHHSGHASTDVCFRILLFDSNKNASATSVKMVKPPKPCEPPKKKRRNGVLNRPTTSSAGDAMKRLQDICKENETAQKSNTCLRLFIDEKDHLYAAHGQGSGVSVKADPMLSLCEVMSNFKIYDHKRWLHREKAILAVILAYSLPQIHESSWWQSLWDSNSISFLGTCPPDFTKYSSPDQRIKLRKPFTFSTVADAHASPSPGKTSAPRRNAHLHALGVVLLEIYLNRSIKADVDAQGNSGNDYRAVALDLLEEHSDDINMTPKYLRAVQFCLSPHPNPYSGSFSFKDKGFREIFYSEVVSMLEENLMSRFDMSDSVWSEDTD